MQVLIRKSDTTQDIKCTLCGQGFRLYWERTSMAEREEMRHAILESLHRQHSDVMDASAHPAIPFNVPTWHGLPQFSGAALLGGLSGIRRVPPVFMRTEHTR